MKLSFCFLLTSLQNSSCCFSLYLILLSLLLREVGLLKDLILFIPQVIFLTALINFVLDRSYRLLFFFFFFFAAFALASLITFSFISCFYRKSPSPRISFSSNLIIAFSIFQKFLIYWYFFRFFFRFFFLLFFFLPIAKLLLLKIVVVVKTVKSDTLLALLSAESGRFFFFWKVFAFLCLFI